MKEAGTKKAKRTKKAKNVEPEIKLDMQKLLGLDKRKIEEPKADGELPEVGSVVTLVERKYFARVKQPIEEELGIYRITRITKCLVECTKLTRTGATYTSSFNVSDFKAGLMAVKKTAENEQSFAGCM